MSLPSGYKRLEYIQSSGTQYIDSGLIMNKSDSYEYMLTGYFSNNAYGGANGYMQFLSGIAISAKSTIKVVYDGKTYDERVYVNGTLNSSNNWSNYNGVNVKIGIFKLGDINNGWFSGEAQIGKLYSLRIKNADTTVRDFIPCINPSGVVGLYDLVGKQFYGNAGTGTFTAGPIIAIAADKSEITKLEYIQSTGTQYIDTGFNLKNDSKVVLDCDISYSSGSNWDMIFGTYDSSAWFSWWANGGYINAYYGSEWKKTTAPSGRIILIADGNNWTANGTTMIINASTFTAPSTAYIFSIHNGGSYTNASMKLYSCQIYDNGTLVRDFIAAKLSDGTVGLYDKLNGLLYINVGTGTFTAGPVKEPPPAPATLQHLLAVRLAWSAVDGATSYNVYRDDVLLTSTTETTFIDLTAAENTEYIYAVSAVGSDGESAKTTLTVYTKSGYFLYKPYIESATF